MSECPLVAQLGSLLLPSSHTLLTLDPDLSWVFFASLRDPGNTEVSVVWQKEIRSHSVAVGSDQLL